MKTYQTLALSAVAGAIGGGLVLGLGLTPADHQTQTAVTKLQDAKTTTQDKTASQVYEAVAPAVVSILNLTKSGDNDYQTASEGSGVIYQKDGQTSYIVTNNHVIDGADKIKIILNDGSKIDADLVGKDDMTDLAVLKVNTKLIKETAEFANSDKLLVGQTVLAIGSPLGTEYASSATEGILSATNRRVESQTNGKDYGGSSVLQTDAAINPGNSGGPLINMAGQVIGINSMKLSESASGQNIEGIGFAIPANTVVKIINQLMEKGKVIRPALGVSFLDLQSISDDDRKNTLKIPDDVKSGLVLMEVTDNGPAKKAGIQKYDVIVGINKQAVTNQGDLRDELYQHKIGDKVTITYYHESEKKTVTVTLTDELK